MIVIPEKEAVHIEKTATQVLLKDPIKWATYTIEILNSQQELYLETLNEFDGLDLDMMEQKAHDMLFNICVYLAIFRTLLQHKKVGPIPLHLIPTD